MENKTITAQLSDQLILEIQLLSSIARTNGSHISLRDIATLTSTSFSERELEEAWSSNPTLSSAYEVKQDRVLERRNRSTAELLGEIREESEKQIRAAEYITFARGFQSWCKGKQSKLLSVSGSTSYLSPSRTDDLDFFAIARQDSLWIFLTRALILARFFRALHRGAPRICFSYAIDEGFAEREFAPSNDPLSARDALTTLVVYGSEFYTRLLRRNSWISNYFPRLYRQRTGNSGLEAELDRTPSSTGRKFLNLLLFYIVGGYIQIRSALLNRKLLMQGKTSSIFSVKMGRDRLIFESTRYSNLRRMYHQFATPIERKQTPSLREGE